MNEFVEECRREWRRLGVPDPIANEMAADLSADIEEAESEGGTAEDVVGNSAFDPRQFAGSWAMARGVTAPPAISSPPRRWPVLAFALIASRPCSPWAPPSWWVVARAPLSFFRRAGILAAQGRFMCSLVLPSCCSTSRIFRSSLSRPSSCWSLAWWASVSPFCTWPPGTAPASGLGRSADTVLPREPPGHDRPR